MCAKVPKNLPNIKELPRGILRELLIILVPAMALMALTKTFAAGLTAEQILKKVSETYTNQKSFQVLEKYVDSSLMLVPIGGDSFETEVSVSKPGKVRLSNKFYLLVSDGRSTWTYLRRRKQYTEIAAAPLLENTWGGTPSQGFYLSAYVGLGAQQGATRLLSEQRLIIGAKEAECYVVGIDRSRTAGGLRLAWRQKLWIDKTNFLVWRDEFADLPSADALDGDLGYHTASLLQMNSGPISDEEFEFAPPRGAVRVDSFDNHVWSEILAPDAPGARFRNPLEVGVGKAAPHFAVSDFRGSEVNLDNLRGKIVVLNFWASWCQPCQKELSDVQKLHDQLGSKDVIFLGIDDEGPETMSDFVKASGYTLPMLDDKEQAVHQLYDVRWAPTTVVIDRKGNIAALWIGAGGEAQLRKALATAGLEVQTTATKHQ